MRLSMSLTTGIGLSELMAACRTIMSGAISGSYKSSFRGFLWISELLRIFKSWYPIRSCSERTKDLVEQRSVLSLEVQ